MLNRSPHSGTERLEGDGAFTSLDSGGPGSPLLLARDLCAFQYLDLDPAEGLDKARRHAREASPFLNPGWIVRPEACGAAIWWWDQDRVDEACRDRFGSTPALLPAPLAEPPAEGWRIVRQGSIHDAQFWRDGVRRASSWQPEPFDAATWAAFTRMQRGAAPSEIPPTAVTPVIVRARIRSAMRRPPTLTRMIGAALGGAAVVMAAVACFNLAQGVRLRQDAADLEAQAPTTGPNTSSSPSSDHQRMEAWRAMTARPDPVATLAFVLGTLKTHGVAPVTWAADHTQVNLTLPYSALPNLDTIADDLTRSGRFTAINPRTKSAAGTIELQLEIAPTRQTAGSTGRID